MIEPTFSPRSRTADYGRPVQGGRGQATPWIEASDIQELVQPLEGLITKYPAAALASAFLLGVAVACWIKRK